MTGYRLPGGPMRPSGSTASAERLVREWAAGRERSRRRRPWLVGLLAMVGVALVALLGGCAQYGTTGGEVTGLSYERESGSILGFTGECWRVEFEDAYGRTGARCTSESRWSALAVGDDYGTPKGAPSAQEVASRRSSERAADLAGVVGPIVLGLFGLGVLATTGLSVFRSLRGARSW